MPALRPLSVLVVAGSLAAGFGCGERKFATEGDTLRERVLTLEDANRSLNRRVAELEVQLEEAARRPEDLSDEVQAVVPHVVEISLGRLSHVVDRDGDGRPDLLRAYVKPADGLGRFVQLAGVLSLNAAVLPAGADAITLGRVSLTPAEVRAAYRGGVAGSHYTVECPITAPAEIAESQIIVRAVYTDGRTGRTCSAERAVALK